MAERKVTVVLTETEANEVAKLAEFADGPALDALNKVHDARRYWHGRTDSSRQPTDAPASTPSGEQARDGSRST